MKEPITAADCQRCGACCVSPIDQDAWADVDAADLQRLERGHKRFVRLHVLPDRFSDLGGEIATRRLVARSGPAAGLAIVACAALRGSPLSRCSCRVYDARPEPCRAMTPGGEACRTLRASLREQIEEALT